jgi:tRNA (adenine57-N1/adenine58-N1)-methyltransferase
MPLHDIVIMQHAEQDQSTSTLHRQPSTFLSRGQYAEANSLASLHLKRDLQCPILLREEDENNEGYDEGKVTNTRFGSFPHSTLIGLPWGSQIRASAVDTGSRGRKAANSTATQGQKRKRDGTADGGATPNDSEGPGHQTALEASTGFAHLLPPTPESWTASLPHRTQVVYTPDYSYILQRLRVRTGAVLIEAGAGSGSFTHAAARAVFNGYPRNDPTEKSAGRVFSFEFHEQRVESLRGEISSHGLDGIVHITHRDVYENGFQIRNGEQSQGDSSPVVGANAVFLDLPAPWLALPHLTRQDTPSGPSPLSPNTTARLCSFLPCIEQVQRMVSSLRAQGWLEIEMVEIAARRIDVRRERVGLQEEGLRGVNATPASVEESLVKLRELEKRAQMISAQANARNPEEPEVGRAAVERKAREEAGILTKPQRLQSIKDAQKERRVFMEGRLVHKTEPEIKLHTSYLIFAVLPRTWSDDQEKKARELVQSIDHGKSGKSKRQMKREARTNKVEADDE